MSGERIAGGPSSGPSGYRTPFLGGRGSLLSLGLRHARPPANGAVHPFSRRTPFRTSGEFCLRSMLASRTAGVVATRAFSQSPLSRASCSFTWPILKGSKGSKFPVR
jgi:hypothetical protein